MAIYVVNQIVLTVSIAVEGVNISAIFEGLMLLIILWFMSPISARLPLMILNLIVMEFDFNSYVPISNALVDIICNFRGFKYYWRSRYNSEKLTHNSRNIARSEKFIIYLTLCLL